MRRNQGGMPGAGWCPLPAASLFSDVRLPSLQKLPTGTRLTLGLLSDQQVLRTPACPEEQDLKGNHLARSAAPPRGQTRNDKCPASSIIITGQGFAQCPPPPQPGTPGTRPHFHRRPGESNALCWAQESEFLHLPLVIPMPAGACK